MKQREIKFRAWNEEHKRMSESFDLEDLLMMRHTGADFTGSEVMQYTGLLDKNGKEIYEGDIMDNDSPYEHARKVTVIWDDKDGCWTCTFGGKDNISLEKLWLNVRSHEIIGNIYENPNLLK